MSGTRLWRTALLALLVPALLGLCLSMSAHAEPPMHDACAATSPSGEFASAKAPFPDLWALAIDLPVLPDPLAACGRRGPDLSPIAVRPPDAADLASRAPPTLL